MEKKVQCGVGSRALGVVQRRVKVRVIAGKIITSSRAGCCPASGAMGKQEAKKRCTGAATVRLGVISGDGTHGGIDPASPAKLDHCQIGKISTGGHQNVQESRSNDCPRGRNQPWRAGSSQRMLRMRRPAATAATASLSANVCYASLPSGPTAAPGLSPCMRPVPPFRPVWPGYSRHSVTENSW